jgi:hypothetical protein
MVFPNNIFGKTPQFLVESKEKKLLDLETLFSDWWGHTTTVLDELSRQSRNSFSNNKQTS